MTRISGKQFIGDFLDFVSGSFRSRIQAGTLTADRTLTAPDADGTIALQTARSNSIQAQTAAGLLQLAAGADSVASIATPEQIRSAAGLGTISTQNENAVNITEGSINAASLSSGLWKRTLINSGERGGDFSDFVILLHPAYDGVTNSPYNVCNGDIFISRGSPLSLSIATQIKVFTQSVWQSDGGYLEVLHYGFGVNNNLRFRLCKCQYGGIPWMAIRCTGVVSQYNNLSTYSFEGLHNAQGNVNALKIVGYYTSSPVTILNAEINSSILDFAPTFSRRYLATSIIFGERGAATSVEIGQGTIQINGGGLLSGIESITTTIASPGSGWSFAWAKALVGDMIQIIPKNGSSAGVVGRCSTAGTVLADTTNITNGTSIELRILRTIA
jgi:hypothetical protein